jgi:hypothetical protein
MNTLKTYLSAALAVAVAILGALLFRQQRKAENAESELATEKANTVVKETDHDREIAKVHADELVANYERLKREYDTRSGGSGGDTGL